MVFWISTKLQIPCMLVLCPWSVTEVVLNHQCFVHIVISTYSDCLLWKHTMLWLSSFLWCMSAKLYQMLIGFIYYNRYRRDEFMTSQMFLKGLVWLKRSWKIGYDGSKWNFRPMSQMVQLDAGKYTIQHTDQVYVWLLFCQYGFRGLGMARTAEARDDVAALQV